MCDYLLFITKDGIMLKVIAEDFIKTEAIEIVMPLYRELVAATKQEPLCISYDLYVGQKKRSWALYFYRGVAESRSARYSLCQRTFQTPSSSNQQL